jgi:hypothetical protein
MAIGIEFVFVTGAKNLALWSSYSGFSLSVIFLFTSSENYLSFSSIVRQWKHSKQYLVVIVVLGNWNFAQTFELYTNLFTGGNYPINSYRVFHTTWGLVSSFKKNIFVIS